MMAVQHTEHIADDDFEVIELTDAEYEAAVQRALAGVGLTYEQLAEQACQRDFSSPDARSLWLRIKPI